MTHDYTNCFAYTDKFCRALKEKICSKHDCPFYKTKESTNPLQIELDIHNYSATLQVYSNRNHQIYE